jgi:hypothetical protein
MKSSLLAAAISGMVLGAASLAQAATAQHESSASTAFDTGAQQVDDHTASKHGCKGKNDCKSQGGCKTDKHACKSQNDCKGQGGCKG